MPQPSTPSFVDFLTFCGATVDTIMAVNLFASAVMAMVLLWLSRNVLQEQRWVRYIGIAFAIFILQYLLLSLITFTERFGVKVGTIEELKTWTRAICSTANNMFFLASAFSLLGIAARYLKWPIAIASSVIVTNAIAPGFPSFEMYRGYPDAILSFGCLTIFGISLAVNIGLRRRRLTALTALLIGMLYGFLNVVDAAVPQLVRDDNSTFNRTFQMRIDKIGGVLQPNASLTREKAAAAAILAIAAIFKFFLFAATLLPIIRSISMLKPSVLRETLHDITHGQQEFYHHDGFIRAIGVSYETDIAEICMKVPGSSLSQTVWWRWYSDAIKEKLRSAKQLRRFEVVKDPFPEDSPIGKILASYEESITIKDLSRAKDVHCIETIRELKVCSMIALPIRYHGATIGGLILSWQEKRAFSETIVLQLELLADFLGASLQSERQLSALDQCGFRLPELELHYAPNQFTLSKRAGIVHDVMSPLATVVRVAMGFRSVWAGSNQWISTRDYAMSREEERHKNFANDKIRELAQEGLKDDQPIKIIKTPLRVNGYKVGLLRMAYIEDHEDNYKSEEQSPSPALGENNLHRRTVGSMLADAILDSARFELSFVLSKMQVDLTSEEANKVSSWFKTINEAAKKSGLLWVVARVGKDFIGHHGNIILVKNRGLYQGTRIVGNEAITIKRLRPHYGRTQNVIMINLPVSKASLWCGVARQDFGFEMKFFSPWKDFLERYADAADAALTRISATQDLYRMTIELARRESFTRTLVTTGTMSHQLFNFVNGIKGIIGSLEFELKRKNIETSKLLISSMKQTTSKISDLLLPLREATTLDERRPCKLREAIEFTLDLHLSFLEQAGISYSREDADSEIEVDVEYYVLALALANLTTNAIDAMKDGGTINFIVQERDTVVECAVKDTGPGIDPSLGEDIFNLGVTSKAGSGGWGLYLTKRSIVESHGDIKITRSGPDGAEFTLFLPRPPKATVHSYQESIDDKPSSLPA